MHYDHQIFGKIKDGTAESDLDSTVSYTGGSLSDGGGWCSDSNWTIMDAKQSPTDVKLGIVYIEASLLDCFMMDLRASNLR